MISILNCDQMYTQCWVNFSDYMMKEFKRWNSVGTCNLKHIEIRAGYLLRVGKVLMSWNNTLLCALCYVVSMLGDSLS